MGDAGLVVFCCYVGFCLFFFYHNFAILCILYLTRRLTNVLEINILPTRNAILILIKISINMVLCTGGTS